jgi:hypothetical protein
MLAPLQRLQPRTAATSPAAWPALWRPSPASIGPVAAAQPLQLLPCVARSSVRRWWLFGARFRGDNLSRATAISASAWARTCLRSLRLPVPVRARHDRPTVWSTSFAAPPAAATCHTGGCEGGGISTCPPELAQLLQRLFVCAARSAACSLSFCAACACTLRACSRAAWPSRGLLGLPERLRPPTPRRACPAEHPVRRPRPPAVDGRPRRAASPAKAAFLPTRSDSGVRQVHALSSPRP